MRSRPWPPHDPEVFNALSTKIFRSALELDKWWWKAQYYEPLSELKKVYINWENQGNSTLHRRKLDGTHHTRMTKAMHSISGSLLRLGARNQRQLCVNGAQVTAKRGVVFAKGPRVRGAIRDPEDIFTVKGIRYGLTEENLKPLKTFLQSKLQGKYELPDKLLLQIITHKSFAHGTQPYNARLSYFGRELIQLSAAKYAITRSTNNEYAINNLNFDSLGSYTQGLMKTDRLLKEYAVANNLDAVFFRRLALPSGREDDNYKPKAIWSTLTASLVGAIASQHGKKAAEEFIEKELFGDVFKQILPATKAASESA
ncbi:hypothetical protein KL948_000506 [Ogataea haglerorum]|nr:hypothetical protein KL951_000506 [Ogataea haglerorum]KAG7712635.1 hypothetical protein KL950_000506 [Ogataea haglerorum]KAG7734940.1 hypothetical protein KL948_000506 [Ogataea haglerorum]KAG7772164.1 hypothetical protein KL931_000504 [Ogataea haglerorum]KAG7783844.1 hypothetical protein KL945_004781 [Ogataea haglerorum]